MKVAILKLKESLGFLICMKLHVWRSILLEARSSKMRKVLTQILRFGVNFRLFTCVHRNFWVIFRRNNSLIGYI